MEEGFEYDDVGTFETKSSNSFDSNENAGRTGYS